MPTPFNEPPGEILIFAADLVAGLFDADFSEVDEEFVARGAERVVQDAVRSWEDVPSYVRELSETASVQRLPSEAEIPDELSGVALISPAN